MLYWEKSYKTYKIIGGAKYMCPYTIKMVDDPEDYTLLQKAMHIYVNAKVVSQLQY